MNVYTAEQVLGIPISLDMVEQAIQYQQSHKYELLFPDFGPFRRDLYPRHLDFFSAGATHRERMFRAGNQTGKTTGGCFEDTAHLTGEYPEWWEGKRFNHPVKLWACAETSKKVREVLQVKLFGETDGQVKIHRGHSTGLIPGRCVGNPRRKSGTPDAIDFVPIKHKSGGYSKLVFKSYEEGWQAFESDVVHVVHLDEEPDMKIYAGSLMRGITVGGILYITVTPLLGLSELQLAFMGGGKPNA